MRRLSELAQFSQDMLIIHPFISSTASLETRKKMQGINVVGDNRQDVVADFRLQFTAAGAWLSKLFVFFIFGKRNKQIEQSKEAKGNFRNVFFYIFPMDATGLGERLGLGF